MSILRAFGQLLSWAKVGPELEVVAPEQQQQTVENLKIGTYILGNSEAAPESFEAR